MEHKKWNILLAEDQKLNAEIVTEMLEEEGFQVQRAADGIEAVKMFEQSLPYTYDLILMDIHMPGQNGYEAAKIIRQMDREDARSVRIYACTADTFQDEKDRMDESGMNGFLTKPIHVQHLIKKLEK